MRGETTWMTVWIGLAVVGSLAGPGAAQVQQPYPPNKWTDQQHRFTGASAADENVEIANWTEELGADDAHWVYATGWVTEMDGDTVVGTRFATYKYNAEANGTNGALAPTAFAYFPPLDEVPDLNQGDTFKAVGIAVDPSSGDVYIVGEAPNPDNNGSQDYALVHYNKNLDPVWGDDQDWTTRARWYDNGGDDIPADVVIDGGNQFVIVTGTSPGDGTGLDIATVAWYTSGDLVTDLWPVVNGKQPVAGVRRYDNIEEDDTAAELGLVTIVEQQGTAVDLNVIVLGTTYNGTTNLNDFTTHDWDTSDTNDTAGTAWDQKFNLGGNDHATGIAGEPNVSNGVGAVWCVGYSEIPAQFDAPGDNVDYSIVSYLADGTSRWSDHWDYYQSGQDQCYDVDVVSFGDGRHIWLTGEAQHGARTDVGTVHYLESGGGHTRDFTAGFNAGGSTTFNYGLAIHISREIPTGGSHGLPYIAGSVGGSTWQYMLFLKYKDSGGSYALDWYRTATGGTGFNEGRDIVAGEVEQPTSGNVSVYPTGVLSTSANGREGSTSRYRE